LLKRYISWVGHCEGTTFINEGMGEKFTKEEFLYLKELDEAAYEEESSARINAARIDRW